jgi:bisphosphoglycerate-independent phosphoglycerate mutase (AlkP superfamily)
LKVAIPSTLTPRQKELMEEFAKEEEGKGSSSWSGKFMGLDVDKAWKRVKQFMEKAGTAAAAAGTGTGTADSSTAGKAKEKA